MENQPNDWTDRGATPAPDEATLPAEPASADASTPADEPASVLPDAPADEPAEADSPADFDHVADAMDAPFVAAPAATSPLRPARSFADDDATDAAAPMPPHAPADFDRVAERMPPLREPVRKPTPPPAIEPEPPASPFAQREPTALELALQRFPAYFKAVLRQPYTTVHTSLRRGDWLSPALLLAATALAFLLCAIAPATMRYRESGLYNNTNALAPLLRASTLWLSYGKLLLGLLLGTLCGLGATLAYLCGPKRVKLSWALALNQASYTLLPVLFLSPLYLLLGLFSSIGAAVVPLLMALLVALRQEAFLRVILSDPKETSCYGRFACVAGGWLGTLLLWVLII